MFFILEKPLYLWLWALGADFENGDSKRKHLENLFIFFSGGVNSNLIPIGNEVRFIFHLS